MLQPPADPSLHPDVFHKGLRRAAIDGVRFNLRNTDAILGQTRKARSGKGRTPCAYAHCAPCWWNWGPNPPLPSP